MAPQPRVGLVYPVQKSAWGSVRSICENLSTAYGQLSGSFHLEQFALSTEQANFDTKYGNGYFLRVANALLEQNVEKLVFLEHPRILLPLLLALKTLDPKRAARIHYYLHVYGDFTLFPNFWAQLGQELEGYRVRLFCASHRQASLVRSFEHVPKKSATAVCPFPVDIAQFSFSQERRAEWRNKLNLGDLHLVLYTGRLSLQKGVLKVLEEFHHQLEGGAEAVLALAGSFDDLGGPSISLNLQPGYFFQRFEEAMSALPASTRSRVWWLGNLGKAELQGLYSAADSFVSLSLYHDEDFGMAPAEALSSGLPALLTDWGGYSSFRVPGTNVEYVPVAISDRGISLDYAELRRSWSAIFRRKLTEAERLQAGAAFAARFSVPEVAALLHKELRKPLSPFPGFGWRLNAPKNPQNMKHGLYREIYSNYTKERAYEASQ